MRVQIKRKMNINRQKLAYNLQILRSYKIKFKINKNNIT